MNIDAYYEQSYGRYVNAAILTWVAFLGVYAMVTMPYRAVST